MRDLAVGLMEVVEATTGHRFCSTLRSTLEIVNQSYQLSLAWGFAWKTKTLCVEGHITAHVKPMTLFSTFPSLKTLILSCSAVKSHLSALAPPTDTPYRVCPKLEHVIICDEHDEGAGKGILEALVEIAQTRQDVKGYQKFTSVRLFSPEPRERRSTEELVKKLKELVADGNFELVEGRRARGWNVDEYFYEGASHHE